MFDKFWMVDFLSFFHSYIIVEMVFCWSVLLVQNVLL